MKKYLIGNIVFYPFQNNNLSNTKYVKGSISGELFLNDIYSKEELLKEFPNAKPCDNLHDVCKTWGSR